ncbi:MAG: ABC transporter permease [Chloroflexota bacterium]|nr:ABC transporter permease [Chloroflexota bacterium]PLS76866.1 MAG: ABC transporter permease [Chloroflexota bacterium]
MATTASQPRSRDFGVIARIWSWFATTFRLLASNKVGLAGFIVVAAIVVMAFIGPYFVPFDNAARIDQIYQPPSAEHWLGTDSEGRDVLSQIIHGGRDILTVGFLAAAMSTFIAVTFGSLSAFVGGWTDTVITWLADAVLTIPNFPLLAVLAGILQLNSQLAMAGIIGLLTWPTLLRAVRAQVLSLKERDYVESARALDLGTPHIIFREIAPNMVGYIAISFTLALTTAMYISVGLIFLGLVPLSGNNWGVMINLAWVRGAIFFKDSFWYIMSPILVIALFQLGLVGLSRSLSEIFDPRLRRGA